LNVSIRKDHTPLTKNAFAAEFSNAGSTIVHAERFAEHARQILVDERNFFGLMTLDIMRSNKSGKYRNCEVSPKANHPLLLFFQFHVLHEDDKAHPNRKKKYLPDRPDLDKVLALMHDEGEDHYGHTPDEMLDKMMSFVENIHLYIKEHNNNYPHMKLERASDSEIKQMYADISEILVSFDDVSRQYRRDLQPKSSYYKSHENMLPNARACRVKAIDKLCNAATFVYRNSKLTSLVPNGLELTKYRDWVINQINQMNDLYFIQPFNLTSGFNQPQDPQIKSGFLAAAKKRHPENKKFFSLIRDVMQTQLDLYAHDLANEKLGHNSPSIRRRAEKYDSMAFSSSINVIDILINRLQEVRKIDQTREHRDPNTGIFGIKFPAKQLQNT